MSKSTRASCIKIAFSFQVIMVALKYKRFRDLKCVDCGYVVNDQVVQDTQNINPKIQLILIN